MVIGIANVTNEGDTVLIVFHGFVGDHCVELCKRKGLKVYVLMTGS